jgi:hypothetical protein
VNSATEPSPEIELTTPSQSLIGKIRVMLTLGFILLFVFYVMGQTSSQTVNILGNQVVRVGNRTVMIKPTAGIRFITSPAQIRKIWKGKDEPFLLMAGDSTNPRLPVVGAMAMEMGECADLKAVYEMIQRDTTATITSHRLSDDQLMVKQHIYYSTPDSTIYLLRRYWMCPPMVLLVQCSWKSDSLVPAAIISALDSIQVTK